MAQADEYVTIVDADDVDGRALLSAVEDEQADQIWVDLEGERVRIPASLLVLESDGRYRFPARLADFDTTTTVEETVVPVVEESVSIRTRKKETGTVRVEKNVREEEEVIDVPLSTTEVEVQRVPVDRIVDEPVAERREGDTLIVPVLEEVLVVEKKLRLKEEIHITTRKTSREHSERVTLRKEEVTVERDEAE